MKKNTLFKIMRLILISIGIILHSCAFELEDENFVELQPPASTHMIKLGLLTEMDTIKIFAKTIIEYELDAFGLDVLSAEFYMDDEGYDIYKNGTSLEIYPESYTSGEHVLIAKIYIKSGTGSLAEKVGAEGYYYEVKWPVIIDGREAPLLLMNESVTNDGYLKISWEKCNQYNFKKYVLICPNNSIHIFDNPDSISFIDKSYIGGQKSFELQCYVFNNTYTNNIVTVNYSLPNIYFEELSLDSIRIYWSPVKFDCIFTLKDLRSNNVFLNESIDSSVTIPHQGFKSVSFELEIKPKKQIDNTLKSAYNETVYYTYEYPKFANLNNSIMARTAYNSISNILYISNSDSLGCYNFANKNFRKIKIANNLSFYSILSCPANSSQIAVFNDNNVYIYENESLINPLIIPYSSRINYENFTNNNRLFFAFDEKIQIFNINSQMPLFESEIIDPFEIISSNDGKYIFSSNVFNLNIFEVSDNSIDLLYSKPHSNYQFFNTTFNPYNPNQIILLKSNTIEVRNCKDFSLVNEIDLTKYLSSASVTIFNIDPVSGNLLLCENNTQYYVFDLESSELIFTFPCQVNLHAKLFNNHIITENLQMINISNYLNK